MNHFPFWPTFQNIMGVIGHIFNLEFKDITDKGLEKAHADVRIYSVGDKFSGQHYGRLYIDPYDRQNKRGGWNVMLARRRFWRMLKIWRAREKIWKITWICIEFFRKKLEFRHFLSENSVSILFENWKFLIFVFLEHFIFSIEKNMKRQKKRGNFKNCLFRIKIRGKNSPRFRLSGFFFKLFLQKNSFEKR